MHHPLVVLVRINADIGALSGTPVEYERKDTWLLPIGGNTMDRTVRQSIVQPLTILDIRIGRVVAYDKHKGSAYYPILLNHITHAALDVAHELLARWIAIAPLGGIAVSSHLHTSVGKDIQ